MSFELPLPRAGGGDEGGRGRRGGEGGVEVAARCGEAEGGGGDGGSGEAEGGGGEGGGEGGVGVLCTVRPCGITARASSVLLRLRSKSHGRLCTRWPPRRIPKLRIAVPYVNQNKYRQL